MRNRHSVKQLELFAIDCKHDVLGSTVATTYMLLATRHTLLKAKAHSANRNDTWK